MGVRTVPQLLGMLRDDPDDLGILQELREVIKTGQSELMGDDPMTHLRDATDRQAEAGEHELGAALLVCSRCCWRTIRLATAPAAPGVGRPLKLRWSSSSWEVVSALNRARRSPAPQT